MNIRCRRETQSGTTLMEVVVAVSILAIVFASLLNSFRYGFTLMRMVRENQRATQILLEKSETFRLYNWEQVTTAGFIPSAFTENYDPQTTGALGMTYYGTIAITNFPASTSYATNIRQIIVTLQWTNTMPHVRSLATLVAKDGAQNYVY